MVGNKCYNRVKKCSDLTEAERVKGVICIGETFCDLFGSNSTPGIKRTELVANGSIYHTYSGRGCMDKKHFRVAGALNDYSCKEYGGHLVDTQSVTIPSASDSNICRNKLYNPNKGNSNNS